MANKAIEAKIKSLGFCCPYAYFTATNWVKAQYVARELNCSKGSVHNWRRQKPTCPSNRGCFEELNPEPAPHPGTDLDRASSEFHFPLCVPSDENPEQTG